MSKTNLFVMLLLTITAIAPRLALAQGPRGQVVPADAKNAGPAELKIQAALDKTVELKFEETPLKDVVEFLKNMADIGIELDTRALDVVGIGTDTPITRNIKGVSLRSALKLILRELDLTYMLQNEVLMITTLEEAESQLSTKVYEVRDLVLAESAEKSLVYSPVAAAADFDSLIEVITSTVAPNTWDEVGGPGSISAYGYSNKHVLIISQTEEVHEQIADLLDMLRKVEPLEKEKKQEAKVAAADKAEDFVKVYPLTGFGSDDAGDVADLIREATGADVWSDEKGTFVRGKAKAIVVKHNQQIHDKVYELLVGIEAIEAKGSLYGGGGFGMGTSPRTGGFSAF